MNRVELNRLKWKCRRGLLELDLVLERFLQAQAGTLDPQGCAQLHRLLDLPDPELWNIVAGRSDRYDPQLGELVARLRAI